MSNYSVQKYWESKKEKEKKKSYGSDSSDSGYSSEKNHATSKKKNSALLQGANWHIWQPKWCSQGSVLRFSQCF